MFYDIVRKYLDVNLILDIFVLHRYYEKQIMFVIIFC